MLLTETLSSKIKCFGVESSRLYKASLKIGYMAKYLIAYLKGYKHFCVAHITEVIHILIRFSRKEDLSKNMFS